MHHGKQSIYLAVFPPVLVLEFGGAALELRGSGLQGVGPVVELRQLLVSLQDFVHIHAHDVHHLVATTPVTGVRLRPFILPSFLSVGLTSSTCACVCCSRLLLVRFGAGAGGPPSPSGAPGVPAASGVDLQMQSGRRGKMVMMKKQTISTKHEVDSGSDQPEALIQKAC